MLGVELYSSKIKIQMDYLGATPEIPRINFDSLFNAVLCVFICLIGDNWNDIMIDVMRSDESHRSFIYFLQLILFGQLFLMNIFLAIHIKSFQKSDDEQRIIDQAKSEIIGEIYDKSESSSRSIGQRTLSPDIAIKLEDQSSRNIQSVNDIGLDTISSQKKDDSERVSAVTNQGRFQRLKTSLLESSKKISVAARKVIIDQDLSIDKSPALSGRIRNEGSLSSSHVHTFSQQSESVLKGIDTNNISYSMKGKGALFGKSLNFFSATSPLRIKLNRLIAKGSGFEIFIMLIIIIQSIAITYENPVALYEESFIAKVKLLSQIITVLFILEAIIKIIVYGFLFNGPDSYLRDGWNIFDFIVVVAAIFSEIYELATTSNDGDRNLQSYSNILRIIKTVRILRSLRILSRNEGLKHCVLGLIYSFPGIINVTLVVAMQILVSSIFFVTIFSGKFQNCEWPSDDIKYAINQDLVISKQDCVNYGGIWENNILNFDDIPNAMLSQFVMLTKEGWISLMFGAADSTEIGLMPKQDSNYYYTPIFVVFMLFSIIFIINLFTEVVIATYEQQRQFLDQDYALTEFQLEWIQVELLCYESRPDTKVNPQDSLQKLCLDIINYPYFDTMIMFFIILNTIMLTLVWVPIDDQLITITETLELIFLIIFGIECLVKVTALRKVYFNNNWNIFDFIIVIGGLLLRYFNLSSLQGFSVIRILRTCRVFRLLKQAKRLNAIFNSFIHTIPTFINVFSLILIMMYVFAVTGSRLFQLVKINPQRNHHLNFLTFYSSFQTLTVVMTGEAWFNQMYDFARQKSVDYDCVENSTIEDFIANGNVANGCGTNYAYPFFICYIYIVSLILLNLFIAVTIQGFKEVQRRNLCRINEIHIQQFIDVWAELDPDGTGYIHSSELGNLIRNLITSKCELLPPKSKIMMYDSRLLSNFINKMDLTLYKNFQSHNFYDILIKLAKLQVSYIVQRKQDQTQSEYERISQKYEEVNKYKPHCLEEVFEKIVEIQKTDQVQMCKKLAKKQKQFKQSTRNEINRYGAVVYTVSIIPVVIRLQRIYRKFKLIKAFGDKIQEMKNQKKFKRSKLMTKKNMLLSESSARSKSKESQDHDKNYESDHKLSHVKSSIQTNKVLKLVNKNPSSNSEDRVKIQNIQLENFPEIQQEELMQAIQLVKQMKNGQKKDLIKLQLQADSIQSKGHMRIQSVQNDTSYEINHELREVNSEIEPQIERNIAQENQDPTSVLSHELAESESFPTNDEKIDQDSKNMFQEAQDAINASQPDFESRKSLSENELQTHRTTTIRQDSIEPELDNENVDSQIVTNIQTEEAPLADLVNQIQQNVSEHVQTDQDEDSSPIRSEENQLHIVENQDDKQGDYNIVIKHTNEDSDGQKQDQFTKEIEEENEYIQKQMKISNQETRLNSERKNRSFETDSEFASQILAVDKDQMRLTNQLPQTQGRISRNLKIKKNTAGSKLGEKLNQNSQVDSEEVKIQETYMGQSVQSMSATSKSRSFQKANFRLRKHKKPLVLPSMNKEKSLNKKLSTKNIQTENSLSRQSNPFDFKRSSTVQITDRTDENKDLQQQYKPYLQLKNFDTQRSALRPKIIKIGKASPLKIGESPYMAYQQAPPMLTNPSGLKGSKQRKNMRIQWQNKNVLGILRQMSDSRSVGASHLVSSQYDLSTKNYKQRLNKYIDSQNSKKNERTQSEYRNTVPSIITINNMNTNYQQRTHQNFDSNQDSLSLPEIK